MLLPATPETAAAFFGTWKAGAILLSMSVLYGDEGIRHRVEDSQAKVVITDAENAGPDRPRPRRGSPDPRRRAAGRRLDALRIGGHGGGRPRAALLLLRHHRPREGHPARAPLSPCARGVHLLPRRPDGELFHGMGEWAWAAGIAPLLGPWRFGATQFVFQRQGGFDPEQQLAVLSKQGVTNVFTTPTAMRSMMAVERRRQALPAAISDRVLGGRAAEPGGDPLVPRAVRPDGARLLRADRVVSAVCELPVHGGARGVDGAADARLGRADTR